MDRLLNTTDKKEVEEEFSFKNFFIPFTTLKAIHWIIIIGLIVYANMLFNGFVNDDIQYIVTNKDLHQLNFLGAFTQNTFNDIGQYRPLVALYFEITYFFFNQTTFFYHIIQLLIHIINSVFVFLLFKKFLNKNIALYLSVLFLIHPIQVESVSYISAIDNSLFFLFGISALLLSITSKNTLKNMLAISILLLLSVLTKETGFLFLVMIIIYQIIFKKKNSPIFYTGILATTFLYFFIRFVIGKVFFIKIHGFPLANMPLLERLYNIPAIIFYYLKTFFYPYHLAIDQKWLVKTIDFQNFYFPLCIDIIFFASAIVLGIHILKTNRKNFQVFLFFFIWFVIGLTFHLQIFPLDMTVADRWFYFPIVGLLGIIGVGIQSINEGNYRFNIKNYSILGISIILLLSFRTIARNNNLVNNLNLYEHDVQLNDNYDLENSLAAEYFQNNNYQLALNHFLKAQQFFSSKGNLYDIGYSYQELGNINEAKKYYYLALNKKDPSAEINDNVTILLYEKLAGLSAVYDSPAISEKFILPLIRKYPKLGSLWTSLAITYYKEKDHKEAVIAAWKGKTLLPNNITNYVYTQIVNNQPLTW